MPVRQKSEIYFDCGLHRHRLAILLAGAELPFFHGFDGFLVKTQAEWANPFQVAGIALLVYADEQNHSALELGFAGFLGIFRLHFEDHAGRRDAAPHPILPPPHLPAPPSTLPRPPPPPHPPPHPP